MVFTNDNDHLNNAKNDVLRSTQTIIHKALEKLGYPEEVYELAKGTIAITNGKNSCTYG